MHTTKLAHHISQFNRIKEDLKDLSEMIELVAKLFLPLVPIFGALILVPYLLEFGLRPTFDLESSISLLILILFLSLICISILILYAFVPCFVYFIVNRFNEGARVESKHTRRELIIASLLNVFLPVIVLYFTTNLIYTASTMASMITLTFLFFEIEIKRDEQSMFGHIVRWRKEHEFTISRAELSALLILPLMAQGIFCFTYVLFLSFNNSDLASHIVALVMVALLFIINIGFLIEPNPLTFLAFGVLMIAGYCCFGAALSACILNVLDCGAIPHARVRLKPDTVELISWYNKSRTSENQLKLSGNNLSNVTLYFSLGNELIIGPGTDFKGVSSHKGFSFLEALELFQNKTTIPLNIPKEDVIAWEGTSPDTVAKDEAASDAKK